jgi:hypothetical protein
MTPSPCVIHNEGLCPSNGGINRLMMMNISDTQHCLAKTDHDKMCNWLALHFFFTTRNYKL